MQKLLDIQEAADQLKKSVISVRRLVYSEKISHLRIGNSIRFKQEYIDTYLDSCLVPAKGGSAE